MCANQACSSVNQEGLYVSDRDDGEVKRDELLKEFQECVSGLISLLRSQEDLTQEEQLFIENRIVILQMEYRLRADRFKNGPHSLPNEVVSAGRSPRTRHSLKSS